MIHSHRYCLHSVLPLVSFRSDSYIVCNRFICLVSLALPWKVCAPPVESCWRKAVCLLRVMLCLFFGLSSLCQSEWPRKYFDRDQPWSARATNHVFYTHKSLASRSTRVSYFGAKQYTSMIGFVNHAPNLAAMNSVYAKATKLSAWWVLAIQGDQLKRPTFRHDLSETLFFRQ